MTLHTKLLEIQKKMMKYGKNGDNPFFKSKYLTLDHLLEVLLPVCNDMDILVYHITKDWNVETHVTDGTDDIVSSFPITNLTDPQKVGSIISYGRRYNLGQIFNIVTDVDDDGNKASIKVDEKDSFNKPNFWKRNMDNLKASIEKWERTKGKDETLEYLHKTYNLKDDAEGWIEEYFDRLPKKEVPEQVGTSVADSFTDNK